MDVLTFLCLLVSMTTVSGLRPGVVENWIHKAFCTGSDVYVGIPWDCSGYLQCDVTYATWTNCEENTKFDANMKSCLFTSNTCQPPAACTDNDFSSNITCMFSEAAAIHCPKYPHLKFAHPKNCAMYYDCGMVAASSEYGLLIYEDECPFPLLFDNQRMMCRADEDSNPVPCNNKPLQQCDYVKECRGTDPADDCQGLPEGANPDPRGVFLPYYILCSRGNVVGRFTCDISQNKVFDPVARTCSSTYRFAIESFCKQNPAEIFADPLSCSMYYDCSVMTHHQVLDPYETECNYLDLFDLPSKSCRRYNESVSCDTRPEPKAPCDYRVSDCAAGGSCLPCSANCVGLPDGLNPYPGYGGTRFHVLCDKERTLEVKRCTEPQIFRPDTRDCGIKDPQPVPQTEPTASPTTSTPPQQTTQPTDPTPTPATDPTQTPVTDPMPTPITDPTTTPSQPTTPLPICDKPCGLDKHQSSLTSMFEDVDRLNELAALRPEFICASPPSVANATTKVFIQDFGIVTKYVCEEDHEFCGRVPRSLCMGADQWLDPRGSSCARNVWREFDGDFPYTLLNECPPGGPFTVTATGRHINDIMVLSIANGENQTEIAMILYAKPDGNLLAFGYDTLQTFSSPFKLINNHEWKMYFEDSKIKLYLNGEMVGETSHNVDYSSTLALTVVSGFQPEKIEFRNGMEKEVKTNLPMHSCPDPPRMSHGTVAVSYSSDAAIATYTCDDDYVVCSDVNVIRCNDARGWVSEPEPCVRREDRHVDKFNFCPLYLGSGLEIRFVPELVTVLTLKEYNEGPSIQISIDLTPGNESVEIASTVLKENPFRLDKESQLVVIAFSGSLEFFVDWRLIASIPTDSKDITRLSLFQASQKVEYIKYRYHMDRVSLGEKKLVQPVRATGSSTYRNSPDIAMDGDAAASYPNGACWYSAYGDREPWIQFEMEQLYYVNSVTVSIKNTCSGCGAINLALGKPTFGSAGIDAASLPENLVDGKADTCFSSDESDTWWVVDLQDSYRLEKLKIFGPGNTANVNVSVYVDHPDTENPSVPVSVCKNYEGVLTDPQEIVCDLPLIGRYIKLETGPNVFTACQVEVFAQLVDDLHDIVVKVYKDEPSPGDEGQMCNKFEGRVVLTETLLCTEEMYGRFVRIESLNRIRDYELMTLCEVTLHVNSPVIKSRSPFGCPKPPVLRYGDYFVSYNTFEAKATYKCNEGYRFCSGPNDVITCDGVWGWNRDPEVCVPTHELMEGTIFIPCGLRLGDTLITEIMPGPIQFALILSAEGTGQLRLFSNLRGFAVQTAEEIIVTQLELVYNELFRLEITILSDGLYMSVNGRRIPVPSDPTPHITSIQQRSSPKPLIRNLVYLTDTDSNAVFRYKDNLVSPSTVVQAGSTAVGSAPERIVDGEATLADPFCWSSLAGDATSYISIDLGKQYFVDGIRYGTYKDCCESTNHDINVNVYKYDPTEDSPFKDLCVYHKDTIPANTMKTLPCVKRRFGRYLKIEGLKRSGPNDNLNLCEVEVYGGVAIHDPSTLPGAVDPCPTWEGYISVESPRLCFKLSTKDEADSYNKAQDACALKDGHLLNLDTKVKHLFIVDYLNSLGADAHDPNVANFMFYVGLKRQDDGQYRWTSGSSFVEKWYETTPDQECGVLFTHGLGDLYGYEPRRYICEIPMFRNSPRKFFSGPK